MVALGVIALALSINLVMLSQDVSTRDEGAYERNVDDIKTLVEEGSVSAFERTNERNLEDLHPPGDVDSNLYTDYSDDFSGAAENLTFERGRYASVDMSVNQVAWRITQVNSSDFTDNDTGNSNWNLTDPEVGGDVGDINETYMLSFNMTSQPTGDFRALAIRDHNDTNPENENATGWVMQVNDTDIVTCSGDVFTEGSFCEDGSKEVIDSGWDGTGGIDVVQGLVNGTDESTSLQNDWVNDSNEYYLRFTGGGAADGTYDILFDDGVTFADSDSTEACAGTPPCGGAAENPVVTGAVQNTTTVLEYVSPDITHEQDIEVVAP